jgi:stage II sporulation protein GA (sporulation sigma-E factor processing peptidase)
MQMTEVYGDLFFMINMSMDFLCLHICAKLLHRKTKVARLILASAVGGVYSVIALFLSVSALWVLTLDVGVCIVMCCIAFLSRKEGIILPTCVYTVVSMVLGGIMTALYNMLNRSGVADDLPSGSDGISAWMFAILAAISGALAIGGGKFFRKSTSARPCKIKIRLFDKTVILDGMCDSGNLICDPMDGRPVVAVDRSVAEGLLGSSNAQKLVSHEVAFSVTDERLLKKLRIIPAGTAVGQGMLVGVLPDEMWIAPEGGNEHRVNALFAVIETGDGAVLVPSQLMV